MTPRQYPIKHALLSADATAGRVRLRLGQWPDRDQAGAPARISAFEVDGLPASGVTEIDRLAEPIHPFVAGRLGRSLLVAKSPSRPSARSPRCKPWTIRRTADPSSMAEFGACARLQNWKRSRPRLRHSPHVLGVRFAYIRTGPAGPAGARVEKTGVNMGSKVWSRHGARSTMRSARWVSLGFVGVLILALALTPRSALAATIDVACGDIPGLKVAIASASPGDTVSLAAGCTYTLTAVDNVDGSLSSPNGLPQINNLLTIEGNGSTITNSGAFQFRFFDLGAAANLTLNRVTLSNGSVANQGGAILLKTGAHLPTRE